MSSAAWLARLEQAITHPPGHVLMRDFESLQLSPKLQRL
jgi:hypothetical protein